MNSNVTLAVDQKITAQKTVVISKKKFQVNGRDILS